jgi:radical SAM/Cys-rich protein
VLVFQVFSRRKSLTALGDILTHGGHRVQLTLLRQGSPLTQSARQLEILEDQTTSRHKTFDDMLREHGCRPLHATGIQVLQINVGKLCNQTCSHCHVDAGPDRCEIMPREIAQAVIDALAQTDIPTLDITGGAPEMNPNFRWLVHQARRLGRRVINRSNLTILLAPGFTDLPEFLAEHHVEIIASLPCYLEENCDAQRGSGVFRRSIEALRRLNALGYGQPESELVLTLVYNPVGPLLPPPQEKLEADYRRQLKARYGIVFSRLYTITNMPISRFLDDLLQRGQYDQYIEKLIDAFNPAAVEGLMCRTTLSVDWQGRLYDCDFNQMLELGLARGMPPSIHELDVSRLANRRIMDGRHCFGCTAGAGSGCTGAIVADG